MRYFVANWKANKNLNEAKNWLNVFLKIYRPQKEKKVILAPPFPFLALFKKIIDQKKIDLELASQDLSIYEEGSYTGEVTAKTLQGLVKYTIIGHSERRINFNETTNQIKNKINLAINYHIQPMLCLSKTSELIKNQFIPFIVYEPIESIGTGYNKDQKSILLFRKKLNLKFNQLFFYGGSVNKDNIKEYSSRKINGFLIGTASLNPTEFYQVIING